MVARMSGYDMKGPSAQPPQYMTMSPVSGYQQNINTFY